MNRKTKKQMVIEIYDREAMGEVSAREIAVINESLVREFGEGGAMSPAEIARVLAEEDIPVRFDQVLAMRSPTERYHRRFVDVMRCETFEAAELAIRRIDELYRRYLHQKDRRGMHAAREAVMSAKRRAIELSTQEESADRRALQAEIAQWFAVWLQTPDLFEMWLELRKASAEFKSSFTEAKQQGEGRSEKAKGKSQGAGRADIDQGGSSL
ncbi:MAG TPA: hypothetical protein VFD58_04755 [Blastocatellia bacterium]|nr:hypothetical protein [Blastocatellia bacterium]